MKSRFISSLALLGLLVSCGNNNVVVLDFNVENPQGTEKIVLKVQSLEKGKDAIQDTLNVENAKAHWECALEEGAELSLQFLRTVDETAPVASSPVRLFIEPGTRESIDIAYGEDFLKVESKSSSYLAKQLRTRMQLKEVYADIEALNRELKALRAQIQDKGEKYVDSLWEVLVEEMNQKQKLIQAERIDFIKHNLKSNLSAYYLLMEREADTMVKYFEMVENKVKTGLLASPLESKMESIRYRKNLEKTAEKYGKGATLPVLNLENLLTSEKISPEVWKGKVLVLDFWGTWCPWCVKGFPKMKEYYAKHKGEAVFIAIACRDTKERVLDMVQKENIQWLQVLNNDEKGNAANIGESMGIMAYPTKLIVDRDGVIVERFLGEVEEFYTTLDELCAKK